MKKKIVTPLIIKCFLLFSFQEVTSSVAMEKEAFAHFGYFKRHGSGDTRRINRQECFNKEVNEKR